MTGLGERMFRVLAGFRRAREMLVSRERLFTAELANFPDGMLRQAAADLREIARLAADLHRACAVEAANNELNSSAAEGQMDGPGEEKFLVEKVCF